MISIWKASCDCSRAKGTNSFHCMGFSTKRVNDAVNPTQLSAIPEKLDAFALRFAGRQFVYILIEINSRYLMPCVTVHRVRC